MLPLKMDSNCISEVLKVLSTPKKTALSQNMALQLHFKGQLCLGTPHNSRSRGDVWRPGIHELPTAALQDCCL